MKVLCEDVNGPRSSLGRAWSHMSWLYYQYLLVTALYMLEPWERTVFSILSACRVISIFIQVATSLCLSIALCRLPALQLQLSAVVIQQQIVATASL
ncbi:hypothetical protein XELAEV_18042635mg [Xenopus laevis]|uniref:Uncharacterized protein n=1 Tax=Xenopus laevis TaxID=8355 RepID=A0A974H686_XENLA|nr:hypothetical protein XELAEV_18042635mg [Xenopus laevis]